MQKTVLENGLTIITDNNENSHVCTLKYLIKSGSFDEKEDEHGIAHLIEHMLFKGTTNRNYKEINNDIENIGGYLNAATGQLYTEYFCTIPFDKWEKGLDVLSDMIFNHTIPEEELIKEKKVVQEELRMYDDDPSSLVVETTLKKVFKDYNNRLSIGGTVDSVEQIDRNKIIDFISRNYFPQNMMVICTGKVDHNKVIDFIQNYINKLNIEFLNIQKDYSVYRQHDLNSEVYEITKSDINQTHIAFAMQLPGYNDFNMIILEILSIMLGGNSSSILFDYIREQRGLAYQISTDIESFHDISLLIGYAGLNKDNNQIIDEIINQIINFKDNISEEKLQSAKNYFIGTQYRRIEKTSGINDYLCQQLMENDIYNIDELQNKVDKITIDDIIEICNKYFNKENICFVKLN